MTVEQKLNNQTTINVREKANLIWSIADIIGQGLYKPHEYGKIILPMTVIKRFNDTLLPTKDKVLEAYERFKHFDVVDGFLKVRLAMTFTTLALLHLTIYYLIPNI